MSVKMLESAPTVKYKRGDCFSVLKAPRDDISKVAPFYASLPQGRPCMRLSLPSPSLSKCSEGLWGKLEWGRQKAGIAFLHLQKPLQKQAGTKGAEHL